MDFYFATILFLFMGAVMGDGDSGCGSCGAMHPQQLFCNAEWVVRVQVRSTEPLPLPGEVDLGYYGNKFIKHVVTVIEIYKMNGTTDLASSDIPTDDSNIELWSPTKFCSANLVSGEEYVISGIESFTPSTQEPFYKFTSCMMTMLWSDTTLEQRKGLTKKYGKMCGPCQIPSVRTIALNDVNKMEGGSGYPNAISGYWTPYQNCYYNPLTSQAKGSEDCENQYSYCKLKDGECRWVLTDAYERCFNQRELIVTIKEGGAAITNRKDCNTLPNRRLKRKCKKLAKKNAAALAAQGQSEMTI